MSKSSNYADGKGLSVGETAPDFSTKDVDGNEIELKNILENNDGLLIDFFRGAWWHTCEDHSKQLNKHLDDFKNLNIKIISISSDSINHLKQYQQENELKFPQISDRGAKIARKYDVDIFDKGAGKDIKFKQAIPSKFLINKSRKIVWTYIPESKTERPKIKTILNAIQEKC